MFFKKSLFSILSLVCVMSSSLFGDCDGKPQVVILLGAPGAGKGTQAVYLREKYHLPHISTGDLFRENLKGNTPIGQKAKAYMEKGALVPDEIVFEMLFDRLSRPDAQNGYILDGFPRTIAQAETLDAALKDKANITVIEIDVPDQLIIDRLTGRLTCESCGTPFHKSNMKPKIEGTCDKCKGKLIQRKDDTESVINERLKVYHDQTEPLKGYYKKQGRLTTVDGTISKEKTTEAVEKAIKSACDTKKS
jgi:adenylate kinase